VRPDLAISGATVRPERSAIAGLKAAVAKTGAVVVAIADAISELSRQPIPEG